MKRITVTRHGEALTITAPADKDMTIDGGLLQHGVLSIGEYGPSGIKIATFMDWTEAIFDAEDHGYTIKVDHPF